MFWCCSLETSHPHLLPQSPKVCSIHLCLFFCFAYRLGRPRGIRWRGRWEGGSGWGTHVNPWLIHFNVWQNPLQYCKVISLQLIKKLKKKKKKDKTAPNRLDWVIKPAIVETKSGCIFYYNHLGHIPCLSCSCFSRVWLFVTLWTIACQGPLSMGFFQVCVLQWVAIFSSKGSSWPRGRTHISCVSCIADGFFIHWAIEPSSNLSQNTAQSAAQLISSWGRCKTECRMPFCLYKHIIILYYYQSPSIVKK